MVPKVPPMKATAKKNFMASVEEGYTDRIEEVAGRLRDKGCEIKQILKLTGVITGKIDHRIPLAELKIEGIQTVEIQRKVRKI